MKIVELDGKPAWEIPLWDHSVSIAGDKKIDKNNDIITQGMIVKWQARKCGIDNENCMSTLKRLIGDCLDIGIYSPKDIERYIWEIKQQKIGEDSPPRFRGDSERFRIMVEPGDDVEGVPYICFCVRALKNNNGEHFKVDRKLERGECAYFLLDKYTQYVFLETFKVFAAIHEDNRDFVLARLDELGKYFGGVQR